MTGSELKTAREQAEWTQAKLARRLRVTQAYVSMLETNRRALPKRLERRLLGLLTFAPLSLPLKGEASWTTLDDAALAQELASLGYPGFAYMRSVPEWNPAELLVAALGKSSVERRVAEGFPWLALHYANLDWNWVVREAKLHDAQNRLGFVLTLAREVAESLEYLDRAKALSKVEQRVRNSQLVKLDTYCYERMTNVERRWLKDHSSPEAKQWNLLSDLRPEHLSHAY